MTPGAVPSLLGKLGMPLSPRAGRVGTKWVQCREDKEKGCDRDPGGPVLVTHLLFLLVTQHGSVS